MADLETDYLIIGAGAVGLAFADTLLEEDPQCHITIVDAHAKPGGHWNDAYPFVALHQPSATYGVNSMELCSDRRDTRGHNAGLFPLAQHAEILAYYSQLLNDRLLPSGRVEYLPLTQYVSDDHPLHTVKGVLSGQTQTIKVRRKLVDGTFFKTSVPSTHKPAFTVAQDTRFCPPGDLPALWKDSGNLPDHYVILGGGKTAMDTAVWLLEAGVCAEKIGWVRPRDSWMINRKLVQPAIHDIEGLIKFQVDLVEAANSAQTGEEMFAELGRRGTMLRIDESITPGMFHFAVISEAEIALLQRITTVYRQGHVTGVEPGAMHFGAETVSLPSQTLFINCTASAVPFSVRDQVTPVFDKHRITVQLAQVPFVPYSASLTAFLEANFDTDEEKNALVPPAPLTDSTATYPYAVMANLMSTAILASNDKINAFNARSRLHPTGPAVAQMIKDGDPRLAKLSEVGPIIKSNMPGVIRLGMKAKSLHETTQPGWKAS